MVDALRPDKALIEAGSVQPGLYLFSPSQALSPNGIDSIHALGADTFSASTQIGTRFQSTRLREIADDGDIIEVDYRSKAIRILLSSKAKQNTLLVTEECNNACVFCSQPPKPSGHFYDSALLALTHFKPPGIIGISGGEPTLFWDDFLAFVEKTAALCPEKSLHLLTHGRAFSSNEKVAALQQTGNLNAIVFGIPLHGANSDIHDKITEVAGSFDETVQGILNLAFAGAKIEIRIVVNEYNYTHINAILDFIRAHFRSVLPSIAIMQLEPVGWAKNRYQELFVHPEKQAEILDRAIKSCMMHKMDVSLYNYPLCHLPESARPFAIQSISDWKNYFPEPCDRCTLRAKCCGFFASATGKRLVEPTPFL